VSSPTLPTRSLLPRMPTDQAPRVLVVEDETSLSDSVRYNLEREGFTVTVAENGARALERFRAEPFSLVILDLMLPELSGLDVCRAIRAESDVPIIMVTAKDSEADKVAGLELGADDYVTKPFSVRELVSRVRANLRRQQMRPPAGDEEVLRGGPVEMDVATHEVLVGGEGIAFPPKEFELLEAFLRRKGRLLTRDFLIEEVWGPGYFGDTKTLDVHVKRLRRKIEGDAHRPVHLVTVRGLGYKFID
jgi:two-component system, OmpR family, response regulator RegX3